MTTQCSAAAAGPTRTVEGLKPTSRHPGGRLATVSLLAGDFDDEGSLWMRGARPLLRLPVVSSLFLAKNSQKTKAYLRRARASASAHTHTHTHARPNRPIAGLSFLRPSVCVARENECPKKTGLRCSRSTFSFLSCVLGAYLERAAKHAVIFVLANLLSYPEPRRRLREIFCFDFLLCFFFCCCCCLCRCRC